MRFRAQLCKAINKLFSLPPHPFNMQNMGIMTYAQWQYTKGADTIKFYLEKVDINEMFKDKVVLDIGCGAGGKTLYYASLGAKKIYGIDVVERYEYESKKLAIEKGLQNCFEFVLGDAAHLNFEENYFDVIIMNDAMEHVDDPVRVLQECYRVLKSGGRLYVNFPPYNHPYGAHLSDVIGIPWVHMLFSEEVLTKVYKDLVKNLPDGEERINFRISADEQGKEFFSYINKMTIRRFKKLINQTSYKVMHYREVPLRGFLKHLAKLPVLKEYFVKMVVCILEK